MLKWCYSFHININSSNFSRIHIQFNWLLVAVRRAYMLIKEYDVDDAESDSVALAI